MGVSSGFAQIGVRRASTPPSASSLHPSSPPVPPSQNLDRSSCRCSRFRSIFFMPTRLKSFSSRAARSATHAAPYSLCKAALYWSSRAALRNFSIAAIAALDRSEAKHRSQWCRCVEPHAIQGEVRPGGDRIQQYEFERGQAHNRTYAAVS